MAETFFSEVLKSMKSLKGKKAKILALDLNSTLQFFVYRIEYNLFPNKSLL